MTGSTLGNQLGSSSGNMNGNSVQVFEAAKCSPSQEYRRIFPCGLPAYFPMDLLAHFPLGLPVGIGERFAKAMPQTSL